jgi:site-specific DNA-methyltransferase (adenine-specific)
MISLRTGDCLNVFGREEDESFDAFVCDPPAGASFMSRKWDTDHGGRGRWIAFWAERFAVMKRKAKPGAYALIWALPRTAHWTATALEDGGWTIQDTIVHVFGQGWPKGKSALKPASEHWIVARNGGGGKLQIDACRVPRGEALHTHWGGAGKLFAERGFVEKQTTVQTLGSWPTNLILSHCPECSESGVRRVKASAPIGLPSHDRPRAHTLYGVDERDRGAPQLYNAVDGTETVPAFSCLASCPCGLSVLASSGGDPPRCTCGEGMEWACPVAEMDRQSGELHPPGNTTPFVMPASRNCYSDRPRVVTPEMQYKDRGGASRFFPRFSYVAKSSTSERDAGCEDLYWRSNRENPFGFDRVCARSRFDAQGNVHPTVKPLALLEWLCSLVALPGDRLGDLTVGSGGTAIAWHRINARARREAGAVVLGKPRPRMLGTRPGEQRTMAVEMGAA